VVGPLIFSLQQPGGGTVVVVPGDEAARICSAHTGYQWIEVLRP
jgi:hypothetical protein